MKNFEQNPAWDLESEYSGFESAEFKNDLDVVATGLNQLKAMISDYKTIFHKAADLTAANTEFMNPVREICKTLDKTMIHLWNMRTYTHATMSVDGQNLEAKKMHSTLSALSTQLDEISKPFEIFITNVDDSFFNALVENDDLRSRKFQWKEQRKQRDYLLSESEEMLVTALEQPGLTAWGDLYSNLSGSMTCDLEIEGQKKTLGLGQTYAMQFDADEATRKAAFLGVTESWKKQQEPAAAILNSLAKFRLEMNKKRAHKKAKDFLTDPLSENKIQRETLNAMMEACAENAPEIRKALVSMAKLSGKQKLDPWDLNAPAPSKTDSSVSYAEGLNIVKTAFNSVDPEFGNFVQMMSDKKWIEARVLPNKRPGAYCTGFVKSDTPRVFMTYTGSTKATMTLAHELGHAYHSWVMRDMELHETFYPMTLAETASIFAETTVAEYLASNIKTDAEKLQLAWDDANEAISLLINIPARFEFEKNFYQQREKSFCTPQDLTKLTDEAWSKWYGDTLSENDKMFWASKMHFSFSGVSFYNFPYTFGYLFSLSIYARRKELGANFKTKYVEILRDTGRMSAEDLIRKHLGEDITKKDFWQKSIDVVRSKVDHFVELANKA